MTDSAASDRILRITGDTAGFRLVPVDATQAANAIADRHGAQGYARQLLGEAVSAALLIASGLKTAGTAQLRFSLSGDISRLAADATPFGLVRAMIPQEEIVRTGGFEPLLSPQTLTVRKLDPHGTRLSQGVVEMITPDISASVTHYLRQSEQNKALLQVAALCDPAGSTLLYAGGFLLESFPGITDAEWNALESVARGLKVSDFARTGAEGYGLRLDDLVAAFSAVFPSHAHREFTVEPFCPCTEEGVQRALSSLGRDGLESLYLENGEAELFCEFCRKRYVVGPEKILELMAEAQENAPDPLEPEEEPEPDFGEPEPPESPEAPDASEPEEGI